MKRDKCRICDGGLETVLDLGEIYQSNFLTLKVGGTRNPLLLVKCDYCGLVQLGHDFDSDSMYREYWYRSSLNSSMLVALQDVVNGARKRKILHYGDVVVDIGANDGSLLAQYPEGVFRVGYDPAKNLAEEARKRCDFFINDYFFADTFSKDIPRASIITSIAMFYDLPDPRAFIRDVKKILKEDGLWVVQFTDLISMLELNAFDNICHEHLEYYSFTILEQLLREEGLSVFDLELNTVNGGSIRAYICHPGRWPLQESVGKRLKYERMLYSQGDIYKTFRENIETFKIKLRDFILERVYWDDKVVAVSGASTKGNTLLQYFDLTYQEIAFAAEVNADKFGLYTVGTNIPIISEEEALRRNPDYFLLLPWHFLDTFKEKYKGYLDRGGKLIVPLPRPAVISREGTEYL